MLGTAPIGRLMLKLAVPAVAAQFINMLYNIVDRIYIGHIPEVGDLALTGVGVTFPIITLVSAFAAFAGQGGAPLAAIQLGAGKKDQAGRILGNSLALLLMTAAVLTVGFSAFKEPILRAFGASDATIGYASSYIGIYLLGTVFVQLALGLNTRGLVNIQYVVYENTIYVIEVNPRASRTIPYISKVTGVPMVDLATRTMLGEKLRDLGYGTGLYRTPPYVACKVPVFSFEKLTNVDVALGPEMKSTGEVLGIGKNLEEALYKGLVAAGYNMNKKGGVLFTVRDSDKQEIIEIADKLARMGFELYGTSGTAAVLNHNMIATNLVKKISDGEPNTITLLESGKIHYMISTSAKGRLPARDSVKMRRKSVERSICCLTAIDTAKALANVLESGRSIDDVEMVDITKI